MAPRSKTRKSDSRKLTTVTISVTHFNWPSCFQNIWCPITPSEPTSGTRIRIVKRFSAIKSISERRYFGRQHSRPVLGDQLETVINKVPKHHHRPKHDQSCIGADEANLHPPGKITKLRDEVACTVHYAVDESEIEPFPEAFTRKRRDRIDNISVVKLIKPPFLLEDPRHFTQWVVSEQHKA